MKFTTLVSFAVVFFVLISCGGDDSGTPDIPPTPPVAAPVATTLVFPEDNTECNISEVLNDTQSTVTFQWNDSENTDSYQVNIRNLNSNTSITANADDTEVPITIERGTPYEWFVISRASGTNETATSAMSRFFNEGPGVENYAPFPAEVVAPLRGSTISSGIASLQWNGSDIDDDIVDFEVLFGTDNDPTTSLRITTDTTIDVDVTAGIIYFWRVISRDSANNSSISETFEFRVE